MSTPEQLTDEALADLVKKGDIEQFGTLMQRYEDKLLRYANRFLAGRNNREDVVQEVFLKTYQNIKSFDTSQKFSPWIYRIAHNTFINELRKNTRDIVVFFDPDTLLSHDVPEENPATRELEFAELSAALEKYLDMLKPKYKEIIILYFYEQLSYKEIADVLQIPVSTVGVRLQRAKDALKKIWIASEPV